MYQPSQYFFNMCGIAGYIGPRSINSEAVNDCMDLMRRRGSGAANIYRQTTSRGDKVLLINSRLKIIDVDDRENQPFRSGSEVKFITALLGGSRDINYHHLYRYMINEY
ncbi:MAG: hypothetical protein VX701_03425 [Chloroflexota bacterium]|nr:hypothetical protein [Chloroflexota bacterium]